jgi:hypothetical protein
MVKHTWSSLSFTHASGPSELSDAVSSAHVLERCSQHGKDSLLVKVLIFCIDALKRIVPGRGGMKLAVECGAGTNQWTVHRFLTMSLSTSLVVHGD